MTATPAAVRESDTALARTILLSLSPRGREIMIRSYVSGQTAQQVARDLGLPIEFVRELKLTVKREFLRLRRG